MARYHNKSIAVLEKYLLSGPAFVKVRYADRLEELILNLPKKAEYPWEYIYFKVTGFRPAQGIDAIMQTGELLPDLAHLLENISKIQPLRVSDLEDNILTPAEAGRYSSVSARTVYRWKREKGLPARIYIFPDGARKSGIKESSLIEFHRANRNLIDRSSRFTRISDGECREICRLLRTTIKARTCSVTEAAGLVAKKTGRATESIRLIAKKNPEACRPHQSGRTPLTEEDKFRIHRRIEAGETVAELAELYGKSSQSIYRIYNSMRARKLLEKIPVPSSVFLPESLDVHDPECLPDDLSIREDNVHNILLAYNIAKKRIKELRNAIDPKRYVKASVLDELERMHTLKKIVEIGLFHQHQGLIIKTASFHTGRGLPLSRLINIAWCCLLDSLDRYNFMQKRNFRDFLKFAVLKAFAFALPEHSEAPLPKQAPPTPGQAERERALQEFATLTTGATSTMDQEYAREMEMKFGLEIGATREKIRTAAHQLGVEPKTAGWDI